MRQIKFAEGEFYHLYNRGVDKRTVFSSSTDYKRFLAYLIAVNSRVTEPIRYSVATKDLQGLALETAGSGSMRQPLVAVGAYCLMPNHFHLYVTQLADGGISKFMQRLQTAYTMYFNQKHERSGSLFQGTFKAEHVDNDAYAKYLFSYIHLNPAKLKDPKWKERGRGQVKHLADHVREYPYSSLREYISRQHVITNPESFPAYISNTRELNDHIDYWLRFRDSAQV